MKTFILYPLHSSRAITIIAEHVVWHDGLVEFYAHDECVGEFQRANVAGVVVVGDDELKGELQ